MNWKFWEVIMRKRRKPTPPDQTDQPAAQSEPESEPTEDESSEKLFFPEGEKVGEPAAVAVPEVINPPDIWMLWCQKCDRVGLHAAPDCDGTPIAVKYMPLPPKAA